MDDYIVRAIAREGSIRAYAAVTTQLANKAQSIHSLYPIAAAALGRTLTAAAMMAVTLKGEDHVLTIQIKGNGPLGGIVAVSDSKANVRGYVHNPEVDLPLREDGKLDVGKAVGREGYLNVIKDLGLKEPYIGFVPLVSGEIGEDITYYFTKSEQIPSAVGLGVLVEPDYSVSQSGGFMIQLMPDADDQAIEAIEESLGKMKSITTFLREGGTPEGMLEQLLGSLGLTVLDTQPCKYACPCSRERMGAAVVSLGRAEIRKIIEEQGHAELACHFCDRKHHFSKEDLQKMLEAQ